MLRDSEERFSPHQPGDIALDHLARYTAAATMMKPDAEVLDIACGEGYGSALLAGKARRVTGIDISAECIEHASERYTSPNLRYVRSDASNLTFPDAFFDAVVSFETIEHCMDYAAVLDEMKRVLKPGGFLVISTPDAEEFNRGRGVANPFHLHEFTRNEFEESLSSRWRYVQMLGQRTKTYSLITGADGNFTSSFSLGHVKDQLDITLTTTIPKPMYLIGVASDAGLPGVPSIIFG
jgi:SAM-dependent methyltransferase